MSIRRLHYNGAIPIRRINQLIDTVNNGGGYGPGTTPVIQPGQFEAPFLAVITEICAAPYVGLYKWTKVHPDVEIGVSGFSGVWVTTGDVVGDNEDFALAQPFDTQCAPEVDDLVIMWQQRSGYTVSWWFLPTKPQNDWLWQEIAVSGYTAGNNFCKTVWVDPETGIPDAGIDSTVWIYDPALSPNRLHPDADLVAGDFIRTTLPESRNPPTNTQYYSYAIAVREKFSTSGYSGSGYSGTSGWSGFSGGSGASGISGYSGPAGGASGYSGAAGTSGYSGIGQSGGGGGLGMGASDFVWWHEVYGNESTSFYSDSDLRGRMLEIRCKMLRPDYINDPHNCGAPHSAKIVGGNFIINTLLNFFGDGQNISPGQILRLSDWTTSSVNGDYTINSVTYDSYTTEWTLTTTPAVSPDMTYSDVWTNETDSKWAAIFDANEANVNDWNVHAWADNIVFLVNVGADTGYHTYLNVWAGAGDPAPMIRIVLTSEGGLTLLCENFTTMAVPYEIKVWVEASASQSAPDS
jgi:hypothetical protein